MNRLNYLLIIIGVILAATSGSVYATNGSGTATAVMEVKVEVISGSAVAAAEAELLMVRDDAGKGVTANRVGEISISLQEGSEVLTNFGDMIAMSNQSNSWNLELSVHESSNGSSSTFTISGKSNGEVVADGVYTGTQIAVIEYL